MAIANDYTTYLHIDDLLALQRPRTLDAPDEMLFIVVHQVYELWFKLVLHELDRASHMLAEGDAMGAIAPLRRIVATDELLISQLRLLETMSPDGFMRFRDPLAPASGFQSEQFRLIEHHSASGGDGSIWHAFLTCLRRLGFDMGDDTRASTLVSIYRDHSDSTRGAAHSVCELLIDHDEAIARWRYHHALMAAREIGRRAGTGGSSGVEYLESTLSQQLFPELWAVRTQL